MNAPGGYPGRSGRTEDIVNAWSETDVFAAAVWLAAQPLDEGASRAMTTLAAKVAASDPERGWEWALRVPQEVYRTDALRQVAAAWAAQDKAAAQRAVESAPIAEAQRAELLKTVTSRPQ